MVRRKTHHLAYWMLGITTLLAFALADAAAVALPATLLTAGQMLAVGFAFLLIAGGLLFTIWRLE